MNEEKSKALIALALLWGMCFLYAYKVEFFYPVPRPLHSHPIGEEQITQAMDHLIAGTPAQRRLAFNTVYICRDERFVPVYIELLHAAQKEQMAGERKPNRNQMGLVTTLRHLTNEDFGFDWQRWAEWYQTTRMTLPPGFAKWRTRLLVAQHN